MGYQGMVHIPPTRALYIGNIADSVDDEILRQHFSQIGPVIRAVVKKDVSSKRHLGYGFIEYQDDRYIDIALRQLQNSNLEGSSLRIEISKTKAHSSRAYRSNGRNPQEMPVPPHRFVRYPLAFDASANSSDYSRTPYDYYAGYGAPVDPYYAMYMPHPGMHVPFDPYAYGQLPPYPQQGVPPGAGKSNQKSSGKGYGRSSGSSKGARYSPY